MIFICTKDDTHEKILVLTSPRLLVKAHKWLPELTESKIIYASFKFNQLLLIQHGCTS